MIEVRPYIDSAGRNSFGRWYDAQEDEVKTRITFYLDRLERGSSAAKGVGAGVMELRLNFASGYRIYFGREGETLVILPAGGTKKRQQLDVADAQQLWREYKQRKRENDATYDKLQRDGKGRPPKE